VLKRLVLTAVTFLTISTIAAAEALPQFVPPLDRDLIYTQTTTSTSPNETLQFAVGHRFRYVREETGLVLKSIGSVSEGKAKDRDMLPLLSGGADLTIRFAVDQHGWPTHVLDWPVVKEGIRKRLAAVKPKELTCEDSNCDMGALGFAVAYTNMIHKLDRMDDRGLINELMPWMYTAHDLPLDAVPGKTIERNGRINQAKGLFSLPGKESCEMTRDEREVRFNLERTVQPESAEDAIRMMSALNVRLRGGDTADMPSEQEVLEAARNTPQQIIEMLIGKPSIEQITYVFDARSGLLILADELHPAKPHGSAKLRIQVRLERE